jgi:hypothetical protein
MHGTYESVFDTIRNVWNEVDNVGSAVRTTAAAAWSAIQLLDL